MCLPDYWLPRPPLALDAATKQVCDALLHTALAQGPASPCDYSLPIPIWQFLCYLVEQHTVVLHGSGHAYITTFEPHQPDDLHAFGAQHAVYAAADGILPLYYAIVDREKSPTIGNACVYLESADGDYANAYYLFSISRQAVALQPYRAGMVYLLPGASFVAEPAGMIGSCPIRSAQCASGVAVQPLAKVAVLPKDFPFLAQIRVHDDERLEEYATATMQGLAWPE